MTKSYNLQEEYGWLLDGIERYVDVNPEEFMSHFGVKSMHWGVRKERSQSLSGLGPSIIERTTKSGDKITLQKTSPNPIIKSLSFISKKYTDSYNEGASFTIHDKDGKNIGNGNVHLRNPDELYLNWITVKNSARGKGYASAALNAARDFGSAQGVKKLTLEVPGNAPDARHIYEKMGFKVTKEATSIDPVWGGLTEMEYNFDSATHSMILRHHGIKGMKWGVRRTPAQLSRSNPGSEEHQKTVAVRTQAKTQGAHTLTNAQLKTAIERMNLEQQYSRLNVAASPKGKQFVTNFLHNFGKQQVTSLATKGITTAAKATFFPL
ncbi:MAG: GNAT family N-acetyltransferase [Sphingomicrobium sp.]